ncbi:MAG: hypothetical protein ACUVWJ_11475, partial [Spirochaetota bacterium]
QNAVSLLHIPYPFPPQLHLQSVVPINVYLHIKGKIGTDLDVIEPSDLLVTDVKVVVIYLSQCPEYPALDNMI